MQLDNIQIAGFSLEINYSYINILYIYIYIKSFIHNLIIVKSLSNTTVSRQISQLYQLIKKSFIILYDHSKLK